MMNEVLDHILSELMLDTCNSNIIDHVKVTSRFMDYLTANYTDKVTLEKSNNGIIVRYKCIPVIIDNTIDDDYKIEFRNDSWYGKFVDVSDLQKYQTIKKEN